MKESIMQIQEKEGIINRIIKDRKILDSIKGAEMLTTYWVELKDTANSKIDEIYENSKMKLYPVPDNDFDVLRIRHFNYFIVFTKGFSGSNSGADSEFYVSIKKLNEKHNYDNIKTDKYSFDIKNECPYFKLIDSFSNEKLYNNDELLDSYIYDLFNLSYLSSTYPCK